MEEKTITLTEAELQARIDESVSKATESLTSKHNGEMASLRTKYEKQLKEKDMSAEEIANERARELADKDQQELNDLRSFKKATLLEKRLEKEGLPKYFVNDSRLLSAEEGDLDKVIKTVKGEYEATLPKGNTHSSVVQVGGKTTPNEKDKVYNDVGEAIGQLFK